MIQFLFILFSGENASIGCVMAAIPNVHIEWEWRGRTIRNMSLMTFGRQMYLIRESSSPAGVIITEELLPTGATNGADKQRSPNENLFNLAKLVQEQNSLFDANNVAQRQYISSIPLETETFQSSARAQPHAPAFLRRNKRSLDLTDDDTYKRTSTLYIMNALEKDSGR